METTEISGSELDSLLALKNTIYNDMPLGIERFDADGNVTAINKQGRRILGLEKEEDIIGKSLFDSPNLDKDVLSKLRKGETFSATLTYNFDKARQANFIHSRKKGVRFFNVNFATVHNLDGRNEGYIAVFSDVTSNLLAQNRLKLINKEIKKAREESLKANMFLNEVIDRIPGAVYMKDSQDEFKYIMANNMYCTIVGIDKNSVVGYSDYDIFSKDEADYYRDFDEKLMNGERVVSYNYTRKLVGRNCTWHIVKSVIRTTDGRLLILGVATDITEIHDMNMELKRAKEEAEKSDRLKSAFLANMSHEIRTPLNAIVGFSSLLQYAQNPEEKEQYMDIVNHNSDLLLGLINDILDLSKIESGLIEIKNVLFDMTELFNEAFMTFGQRCTNPEVEMILDVPYPKCMVELDRSRLWQLLGNFLTNAIKYTVRGHIKMGYECVDGVYVFM